MTLSQTHQHHANVKTPVAEEKLQHYLNRLGVSDEATLTYSQMRKIFVTAVQDLKGKKLSLDALSGIAYLLWYRLSNMEKVTTDLGDVLFDCSEALCPYCADRKDTNLQHVFAYYEKHLYLVIT